MNTQARRTNRWFIFTLALLNSATVFGDEIVYSDFFDLSIQDMMKIIVTSERRVESIQDVALAITALSGDEMLNRGVINLEDLQFNVPGLTFGRISTNGAQVTQRGVGAENVATGGDPGVAIYADGVYLQSTNYAYHDFFDIERVEVLRGPQGTLYGRNAIGGSINIISRPPTEEFSGSARFTAGKYSQRLFQGAVSGPIVEDRLLSRLSLSAEQRDGYFDNVSPLATEADSGDSDYWVLKGLLKFLATENIDVTLRSSIYRDDSVAPPQILLSPYPTHDTVQGFDLRVDPPTLVFANYYELNDAPPNPSVDDRYQYRTDFAIDSGTDAESASLEVNWDLDSAVLISISGYNRNETFNLFDLDSSDVVSRFARDLNLKSETFSQEVRLVSANDSQLEWIAGLYYFHEESDFLFNVVNDSQPDLFGTPVTFTINPAHVEADSYAAFVQTTWQLAEQLGLTFGLRHSRDEKESKEGIFAPNFFIIDFDTFGPVMMEHDDDWNETTAKVGLEYFLADGSLAYAIISTGYKAGGFNIGGLQEAYNPETVLAYEAGFKTVLADGRLQINLAMFLYDYQDLQVFKEDEVTSSISNAAEATSQGIELELVAEPVERLRINATLGWLDATFDTFDTVDPVQPELGLQDLSGNHLSRAPEWKFNIGAQYGWSLDSAGGLTARLDYAWVDDQYYRPYNLKRDKQVAYHVTNARLAWRSVDKRWEAAVWVKNLEDDDVVTNIQVSAATGGNLSQGIVAPPRTYGLTIDYQF